MATAIFFNGRRLVVPQVASKVDASALAGKSPAATGIVALVGTAEGGKPLDATDTQDITNPDKALQRFRSGNLRAASQFVFQPSADQAVPGGAQRLVPVKVNPATQATATLSDATPSDSIVLTSKDYGLFTNQVNAQVAAGTTKGKKLTITFEDVVETHDNVGGDTVFSLGYVPSTGGFDSMVAANTISALTAVGVKAATGLVTQRTADILATGVVRVKSDNAGDTTQTVTIYGLNAANAPIQQTLSLNGTADVNGTTSFAKILGSEKSAATLGTVTISDAVIPTTIITMTAGVLTRGIIKLTNMPLAGALTSIAIDTLAAVDVALFGLSSTGAAVGERWNFTSVLSQAGSVAFSQGLVLALGDVAAARTVTITANAVSQTHASYRTVQRAIDRLNALDGFTASASVTNPTTYLMADLDYRSGVVLFNVTATYTGDLIAIVNKLNAASAYVTAARASGAALPPANTAAAVFLAGAIEGVVTIAEWQAAFTALRKRRINIIVPLTEDPAVHALLLAHLVDCSGRLKNEANGYVGIGTSEGLGETKTNIKSQIQALASRHISACVQEIERYDPDTGEATFYPPWMTAVISAGMQAGSAIGEPLTYKHPTCTDIRNDSSWDFVDDIDELIDAGAMVYEKVDGVGIRCVRSITTHLADDNLVFCEMSANESLNTSIYNFRRVMEVKIGTRGLAGALGAMKGLANDTMGRQVDDEIVAAYRSITIEQIGDVFPVSMELAPIGPVNFIPVTVHLTVLNSTAAAA